MQGYSNLSIQADATVRSKHEHPWHHPARVRGCNMRALGLASAAEPQVGGSGVIFAAEVALIVGAVVPG